MQWSDVVGHITSKRGVAAVGLGLIIIGFIGGAASGKLTHLPSHRPAVAAASNPIVGLEMDVVRDMTLDLQARQVDVDLATRAAIAASPQAQLDRHLAIDRAWAPDRAVTVQAGYDNDVVSMASDPTMPSITGGGFIVTSWTSNTISGTSADVVMVGHYLLDEPGNAAAAGGVVVQPDMSWHLTLTFITGHWYMETRQASPLSG